MASEKEEKRELKDWSDDQVDICVYWVYIDSFHMLVMEKGLMNTEHIGVIRDKKIDDTCNVMK